METAPRSVDNSETRTPRADAAPLTGDLLARKGEAVSAARDGLGGQGSGMLPPAQPHGGDRSSGGTVSRLPKVWVGLGAVLLLGGAVAFGYLSRPALEEQAAAPAQTDNAVVGKQSPARDSDLAVASGPAVTSPIKENVTAVETRAPGGAPTLVKADPIPLPPSAISLPPTPAVADRTEQPAARVASASTSSPIPAPPAPAAIVTPQPDVPVTPPKAEPVPVIEKKPAALPERSVTTAPANPSGVGLAPKAPTPVPTAKAPEPPAKVQLASRPPVSAPPVAKKPYLVQLASLKSNPAATREWGRLKQRFAGLFDGLSPSVQKATVKNRGTFYRLRADGYETRRQALTACRKLKAAGQGCLVVKR